MAEAILDQRWFVRCAILTSTIDPANCQVEVPVRPVVGLPDVFVIAAIHAEIMSRILRMSKLFTAQNAENDGSIRRRRIPDRRIFGRIRNSSQRFDSIFSMVVWGSVVKFVSLIATRQI